MKDRAVVWAVRSPRLLRPPRVPGLRTDKFRPLSESAGLSGSFVQPPTVAEVRDATAAKQMQSRGPSVARDSMTSRTPKAQPVDLLTHVNGFVQAFVRFEERRML